MMQTLAVRGSLVSTTILIRRLEAGDACPPVNNPTWWRQCITACGRLSAQDRKDEFCGPKKEADSIADELFASHPIVYYDHMWPFISTIVNELMDATQRMMATVFHSALTRAFWRELSLYEKQTNCRVEESKHIVQAMVLRTVGHRYARDAPISCPEALRLHLEALSRHWTGKYTTVLPIPTSQFCTAAKLPMVIEWLYDLEVHRRDCLQSMAVALPAHLPGKHGSIEKLFAEKSAKTQSLLPLCKVNVRHIAINPSTLTSLINGAIARGNMPGDFHIKTTTASLDAFLLHFPGLRAYQKQARCCGPDSRLTFCSLRTDGVVASVFFSSTFEGSVRQGQKRKNKAGSAAPPSCFDERKDAELREVAKCPIPSLVGKKRVVCIDPGSRDMIFAVVDEPPSSGVNRTTATIRVPTSNFVDRTKRWKCQELGEASLRQTRTVNAQGEETTLYDACCSLPTYRDVFKWTSYLRCYLPILDDLLRCKRKRALRRAQYDQHLRRDKVLDQVIRQLTGGSLSPSSCRETHIALGSAAACCSSGRGHASAPLGRLRWRLEKVHKIDVTLIDEFRTSQNCSTCREARLYSVRMTDRVRGICQPSWVLKACPMCRNTAGTGPKVWHRDLNAALNIRACFYALAARKPRPLYLERLRPRLPDCPSHFHSDVRRTPRAISPRHWEA